MNRRKAIKYLLLIPAVAEFFYGIIDVLGYKKISGNASKKWFDAGNIADYDKGKIYPFAAQKFYLSIDESGKVTAISTKCTHLGCTVEFKGDEFKCPCHGSIFNEKGINLKPPATRPLDLFETKITKRGKILVNLGHSIRRK